MNITYTLYAEQCSGHGDDLIKYQDQNLNLRPPPALTAPTMVLAVSGSIPAAARRDWISSSEASGERSPRMSPEEERGSRCCAAGKSS